MDDAVFNRCRDRSDWRIAEYSSDDYRFGRIYYRGFNDDIGCRGGGVMNKLNDILKSIRKNRNFNQREFSSIIGVSAPYISEMEKGHKNVGINTVVKVSKKLNVEFTLKSGEWSYREVE